MAPVAQQTVSFRGINSDILRGGPTIHGADCANHPIELQCDIISDMYPQQSSSLAHGPGPWT